MAQENVYKDTPTPSQMGCGSSGDSLSFLFSKLCLVSCLFYVALLILLVFNSIFYNVTDYNEKSAPFLKM